jgi:hypothetical protein
MAPKLTKWPQNIPTSSIARHSKIHPNWDFWFENTTSGNPGRGKVSQPKKLKMSTYHPPLNDVFVLSGNDFRPGANSKTQSYNAGVVKI